MSNGPVKHLEVETYYLHGVGVNVKIDYDLAKISLLDVGGKPKQWVFAERQVEYMTGWQNILDAMKFAIDAAERKLEKHQMAKEKALARKEKDFMQTLKEEGKKMSR